MKTILLYLIGCTVTTVILLSPASPKRTNVEKTTDFTRKIPCLSDQTLKVHRELESLKEKVRFMSEISESPSLE